MKQPLLRVAAVCSSFLLVAGYILYRSGAAENMLPSSKSGRVLQRQEKVMFSGSKSGPVVPPTTQGFDLDPAPESAIAPSTSPAPVAPPLVQAKKRLLPGSKSAVVIEADDETPQPSASPTTQPAPTTSFSLQP
jgi:hypothetical protein